MKRFDNFLIFVSISCLFIIALSGCAAFPKRDTQSINPALLEPAPLLKFADIPYPTGFKILSKNSYVFESAGVRVGLLKYQGKANIDQVINFYKEQMPMYNWNLLNIIEYGDRLMNFDREHESCIISLLPKGKATIITISLGPKSQMPKKSDKPVK